MIDMPSYSPFSTMPVQNTIIAVVQLTMMTHPLGRVHRVPLEGSRRMT